jgi:hypothetical protein
LKALRTALEEWLELSLSILVLLGLAQRRTMAASEPGAP